MHDEDCTCDAMADKALPGIRPWKENLNWSKMELHQVREYETVEACRFCDIHPLRNFLKWISRASDMAMEISSELRM